MNSEKDLFKQRFLFTIDLRILWLTPVTLFIFPVREVFNFTLLFPSAFPDSKAASADHFLSLERR